MPTNVSMEYAIAQKKYDQARTPEEKLSALMEMQRHAPSHKGAEKLRAGISRKIRVLRESIEKQEERKKKSSKHTGIKKEGIGQIVLLGAPNSGKSTLLKSLTNADVEIAPYPFSTSKPEIGMLDYQKAKIQLVELPAIIEGSSIGKANGTEYLGLARTADAIALVLSSSNALEEYSLLEKELSSAGILLNERKPKIEIKKSKFQGISILGQKFLKMPLKEFENYLKRQGLYNVSVIVSEPAGYEEIERALNKRLCYKKAIAIVTGCSKLPSGLPPKINAFAFENSNNSEEFKTVFFKVLGQVLVFTKKPGEKPADKPMALPEGSTVEDAAKMLHQDFYKHLKYAKVWGSAKYPGQKVSKDHLVNTGDILELYC